MVLLLMMKQGFPLEALCMSQFNIKHVLTSRAARHWQSHPRVKISKESQCMRPIAGTVNPELTAMTLPLSSLSRMTIL